MLFFKAKGTPVFHTEQRPNKPTKSTLKLHVLIHLEAKGFWESKEDFEMGKMADHFFQHPKGTATKKGEGRQEEDIQQINKWMKKHLESGPVKKIRHRNNHIHLG